MDQRLGLDILSRIMNWSDDRARREFAWLRLMARLKYDGYRDFLAGVRFIESLATWLQQFALEERETAYSFVRNQLVYVGPAEMQRLVEAFYPRTVQSRLLQCVSNSLGVPKYRIWAEAAAAGEFERLKRKTLFMGLSDGARIDIFRHANERVLANEQIVVAAQLDTEKWQDLLEKLREELNDPIAKFGLVYLVDDFMGTGTTFLRFHKGRWTGKLIRFMDSVHSAAEAMDGSMPFQEGWELCVHHYIASHTAAHQIQARAVEARQIFSEKQSFRTVHCSFGMVLPPDLPIDSDPVHHGAFIELTKKYYDPILRTRHTDVGGKTHLGLGYGGCALPLVLEHNTPNNSVALLWADTNGGVREGGIEAPPMRALFRRRQRYS
jgi:hypothetical protein